MITLSPNYRFHGKAFPMNKKKTTFKIFRGFFKPKGYIIKEEDKLNKNDEYATIKEANRKLKQKTQDTSKGESSRYYYNYENKIIIHKHNDFFFTNKLSGKKNYKSN